MKSPWPSDGLQKAFPRGASGDGLNLLAGDLILPCAVLKAAALADNEAAMRAVLALTGAELWPHGKTTMSPELMAWQTARGASGLTAANVHQMRVMLAHGFRRVLIANQVTGRAAVAALSEALAEHADLELYCLVDSTAGVAHLERHLRPGVRKLGVLVEAGLPGARTGARSLAEALSVAEAAAASPVLELCGVEAYEGIVQGRDQADAEARIGDLFDLASETARVCKARGLFRPGPVILSGGGSQYYDLAARAFAGAPETRTILRSGCYLTHDSGWLARYHALLRERSPALLGDAPAPRAALEVWAHVQSRPEPGLAFATMGKRDVSHDIDLPAALAWFRPGAHAAPVPIGRSECRVTGLNDQHAYLELPKDSPLEVGDMLCFGVSHPCTTFDKWRFIPVVDDSYTVTEVVSTWF